MGGSFVPTAGLSGPRLMLLCPCCNVSVRNRGEIPIHKFTFKPLTRAAFLLQALPDVANVAPR